MSTNNMITLMLKLNKQKLMYLV